MSTATYSVCSNTGRIKSSVPLLSKSEKMPLSAATFLSAPHHHQPFAPSPPPLTLRPGRTFFGVSLRCPWAPTSPTPTVRRIDCAHTRAKRRAAKTPKLESEAEGLVRVLLKNLNNGEKPFLTVLHRYVKLIRTEHCFLLFEELGKRDMWLQCLEVFRWMQKQRWYVADNGIYSKLISVMGKKGQTRMAMWLFSEMRTSGCRPDTSVYNALITAHLHSRDKTKALAKASGYFEKMKGMERCKPNVVTYNILLRAYAQSGDVNKVNALFRDLEESIVSPDVYTYNGVMDAYGKNGMITEMESVLKRMKSHECRPDIVTHNLLIDSYGKRQAFDKMEQVFKSLLRSKDRPTLPTFNSMIINYGKARLRDKVEYIFKKVGELGYAPSYVTYECLITAYGYCDNVSRAREIFSEMMNSGKEMHISTLNAMLDVYCSNGLPTEAALLLEYSRAKGLVPNSSTYKLLYKAFTKAHRKDLVQNLLQQMGSDGVVPNKKFFLEALGAITSSGTASVSDNDLQNSTRLDQSPKDLAMIHE